MDENNDIFPPEAVDEQIEQASASSSASGDVRLVQDLQRFYRSDATLNAQSLHKAWSRIQQSSVQESTRIVVPMERYRVQCERVVSMKKKEAARAHGIKRQLALVAAAVFASLLIGSLAFVLNIAKHDKNSTTGSHGTAASIRTSSADVATVPGIYITEDKNWETSEISRLDKNTHAPIWSHEVGQLSSSIVVEGNRVYVSGGDQQNAYVYALDAANGSQVWQAQLGPMQIGNSYLGFLTSPVVVDSKVYVMQRTGRAYALDAANGHTLWSYDVHETAITDQSGGNSGTIYDPCDVAVSQGMLYGCMHNKFFAVNIKDGAQIWQKQVDSDQILNTPQVVDGKVYLSSHSRSQHHGGQTQTGFVYAYDGKDGKLNWKHTVDNWVLSSPTVADGVVYFGSYDTNVYALKASDGSEKWHYTTDGQIFSSPLLANGVLYVQAEGNADEGSAKQATVKPEMFALKTDGSKLWSKQINGAARAVQGGVLYAGVWPRLVYTFDATTGDEIWHQAYGPDIIDKMGIHNGATPQVTVIP